jgi:osmoprotectant transport system permease protein
LILDAQGGLELIAQGGLQTRERTGASCVAENGFCPDWIADNWDRYVDPFFQHVVLTLAPVAAGFAISFGVALLAHRRRWLITPYASLTGALYTIPSIAFLFLLQPLTGRGFLTAFVALTCYTLLIIFRNVTTGLDGVPAEAKDAARGMGLTERQVLWKVEVPLATPEILAGVRIAATTTVGLAALAFFAGAGGLGDVLYEQRFFKSNIVVAGGLCVLLAAALDVLVLMAQRFATPWRRATR